MRGRFHSLAAALLFTMPGAATLAWAADANGALCSTDLKVDKDKLAAYLIKTYPVSTSYLAVGDNPAPLSSPRALAAWLLEKRAAEKAAGGACSGDSCNVDHMADDLQQLLDGKDAQFKPAGRSNAVAFFKGGNDTALSCTVADAQPALPHAAAAAVMTAAAPAAGTAGQPTVAAAPAVAPPAPQPTWLDHVRVRGNPDQLSIDRNNKAGYASVERARLSLANDDVAQSRTNDVVVYTGYSFDKRPMGEAGSTYEAVPYVGFKQNRVTVYNAGSPTVTTTRTSQVGMLSAFHFAHAGSPNTEDLTARPDYLINNTDGSRLLTLNFTLTPVRPGILNDFIRWNNGLAFKPILIGQSRNGIYVDRGDPTVYDQHQDFIRVGAQAGFTLASTNPSLPFDFTTTYTGLKAVQGSRSIHYWKSVLTYNFNQNVGLSLDYSNGVLPDTADPERKWGLGVSSKF
ncbi:MAG: hypothetical protein GAK35_03422 [Herbaspirillum frisingense]|uniref:Autotransporter outer membrane beta-barrel domain-containing protein n=1 Tax=Herbaspirillum frisingense TaxID=92645 RepID=A0A7V8JT58_9BURK|nr:MAG: hypothetical protein GAK35_03422 [Herbaspirillum frisingense]